MLHHCDLCHIDLDRISVRRGGQVLLQDVSMHIHCGQLTVLIGQNGAGKTTLIRALLGQIPHTGVIRHVDSRGLDIPHLRTGYVPQVLQFDREMPLTVQDFLAPWAAAPGASCSACCWPWPCSRRRTCSCWMSRSAALTATA